MGVEFPLPEVRVLGFKGAALSDHFGRPMHKTCDRESISQIILDLRSSVPLRFTLVEIEGSSTFTNMLSIAVQTAERIYSHLPCLSDIHYEFGVHSRS